jgi:hypothetical protein
MRGLTDGLLETEGELLAERDIRGVEDAVAQADADDDTLSDREEPIVSLGLLEEPEDEDADGVAALVFDTLNERLALGETVSPKSAVAVILGE